MKKTLAQLKRDLTVGTKITQIVAGEGASQRNLNIERVVVKIQGSGVYLDVEGNEGRPSFLDFPKASLLEYEDNAFSIYEVGLRDLTEDEDSFIKNQPSNRPENLQNVINDALSDGSMMYYQDLRYFEKAGKEYLRRTRVNPITGNLAVYDNKVRGKLLYSYKIG